MSLRGRDPRSVGLKADISTIGWHAGLASVLHHRFVYAGYVTQLVKILVNAELVPYIN